MKTYWKKKLSITPWDIHNWITLLRQIDTKHYQPKLYIFLCHCWKEFVARSVWFTDYWKLRSCWCNQVYTTKTPFVSLLKAAVLRIKIAAKKRNHEWWLKEEEAIALIKSPCCYCWNKWSNTISRSNSMSKTLFYNGIDRIDSSKWYIINNVAPCCKYCNRSKNDMSVKDFKEYIKNTYTYLFSN